jgi:hypothetical protein
MEVALFYEFIIVVVPHLPPLSKTANGGISRVLWFSPRRPQPGPRTSIDKLGCQAFTPSLPLGCEVACTGSIGDMMSPSVIPVPARSSLRFVTQRRPARPSRYSTGSGRARSLENGRPQTRRKRPVRTRLPKQRTSPAWQPRAFRLRAQGNAAIPVHEPMECKNTLTPFYVP